jgi:hypothetical protein
VPRLITTIRHTVLIGAIAALFTSPAWAAQQVYQYRIEHPTYGAIGTYTNTVEQAGDSTEVVSSLHVAVKVLGIVVFREDAQRTELWQSDRMTSFEGITTTNGKRIQIHGEARDDSFVITSPSGISIAPANVHPSNPWSLKIFDTNVMMSTKSGKLFDVRLVGNVEKSVTFDGIVEKLHQYDVDGEQRQIVWLNDSGVTIAFRILESGTPVDFVLVR